MGGGGEGADQTHGELGGQGLSTICAYRQADITTLRLTETKLEHWCSSRNVLL